MMAGPLVSVVVPAFDAATTVASTLDPIARQTYQCLVVVIVDDGSTDETSSVVRREKQVGRFCDKDRTQRSSIPHVGLAMLTAN